MLLHADRRCLACAAIMAYSVPVRPCSLVKHAALSACMLLFYGVFVDPCLDNCGNNQRNWLTRAWGTYNVIFMCADDCSYVNSWTEHGDRHRGHAGSWRSGRSAKDGGVNAKV